MYLHNFAMQKHENILKDATRYPTDACAAGAHFLHDLHPCILLPLIHDS